MAEVAEPMSHEDVRKIGGFPSLQVVRPFGARRFERAQNEPINMTNEGGPVIAAPRVITLYVNGSSLADSPDWEEYSRAVVEDGYLDMLSVYGVGRGKYGGGTTITVPPKVTTVGGQQYTVIQQGDLEYQLHSDIDSGRLPQPDSSTIFSIVMPRGTAFQWGGDGSTSCPGPKIGFCGIHLSTSRGILYLIVGSPDCYGCHGNFEPRMTRQGAFSHELAETCTNPFGQSVWDRRSGEEIGDVCLYWDDPANLAPYGPPEKDWWVQREWVQGSGCITSAYAPAHTPTPDPTPEPTPEPTLQDRYFTWLAAVGAWGEGKSEAARMAEAREVERVTAIIYPDVITPAVSAELGSAPKPPEV